ncbi:phage head closure protein [Enterococcus faecalis]|uniref:phage head closure protein n=1 Tax=Enterococcus faecalis TaxID=1351 RepID=UPI00033091E1|nr:phage head closure protein [Enterococcus faecalis]EGO2798141.1 phage head closure protein [Enterococcus faecalis]EGO8260406.1 phage head closure protein [Enterococcus faecalis]EHF3565389.1 phage head closure protein [Enterococcus faecalis]EHR4738392.1 phage head closure protein [Enterococcus faecalis]EIX2479468.1 phage head closure protein [Enterococcus faecalis]
MDRIRETFTDGVLYFGRFKDILSEKKKRIGKEFVEEGKLFFRYLSIREQDYISCSSFGKQVDVKLKTHYPYSLKKNMNQKLAFIIDDEQYEAIKIDKDTNYLYFYLAKVGGSAERKKQETSETTK